MNKKIRFPRELCYALGLIIMPLAIALMTKADLGLSMIAAPTYIISERVSFLTYGQTEYFFQAFVLALMCLAVKKFRLSYLTSFLTALIYGTVLDFFIWCLSGFPVEAIWLRIVLFITGMILTSLGVALFINTYLAPCAYDYFVRTVVEERKLNLRKFKLGFDFCFLVLSVSLTLILFHRFVGVTAGTLVIALCNGHIIAFFNKLINNRFELYNKFPKLAEKF
ncbi:MAG: DUF6198 family protein [Eubacterium sp.]|nr:DUF6198 family protein [Eubacterium sp.]